MPKIAGIILCGGASRRMGRPKYTLQIGGQTLLTRTVGILREVVNPVVLVAAEGQEIDERTKSLGARGGGGEGDKNPASENHFGRVVIVRDHRPYQGPLAGMVRGLEVLPESVEAAFVSAVDLPFLQPAFVRAVVESLGDAEVAVPEIQGVLQPLAAVYRVSLLDRARDLAARGLGPRHLVESSNSVRLREDFLEPVDPDLRSLTTFNTPEEWERVQATRDLQP